jgi:benzoyl-CoA 2,3-dioxygenase component B
MSRVDLSAAIPNNVDLGGDRRLMRALEQWRPAYLEWWREMGPEGFQEDDVYLRTAIDVDREGWAQFGYVAMPEYRWGIFLADRVDDRVVPCGDHFGEPAWQTVPGEYRQMLKRLIVTQADTEPASVEQQRLLGHTAPSLYDLRNLFQVNVEEGRHLWAMVYLLHTSFGRDGREEAEDLLRRRSGDADSPRILGAFNEPIADWLSFFMFTTFTDRDGKFQLHALSQSGFDPLSRTCRFMLTEEAHHMFVGETGIRRIVQRACELANEHGADNVRAQGGIDLATLQRYLNFWFSVSVDLFGGEQSSNAADFFGSGVKGRYQEEKYEDHIAMEGAYEMEVVREGRVKTESVALRNAMNEVLRDRYIEDCEAIIKRWNRVIEKEGREESLYLPHRRFNRAIGIYGKVHCDPQGEPLTAAEWEAKKHAWLPSHEDEEYVKSLMVGVHEVGKIANWIAPPTKGIKDKPFEFEYVKQH